MARIIRTSVVAAAPEVLRQQLMHMLAVQDITLLAAAGNGRDALRLLNDHRPDLLLCDAQLPGMDGEALACRALCTFLLPVRPAVMLLHYPEFPVINAEELSQAGAVFLEKPVSAGEFSRSIAHLQSKAPVFSPEQMQHADALLDALGVPEHAGRSCLKYAALLCASDERCLHNLSGMLYPQLAGICHMESPRAERAMRHAIDLAWQSDKFDNQYRIFADTVDAGRGQPTCSEMISRLADILRLEG